MFPPLLESQGSPRRHASQKLVVPQTGQTCVSARLDGCSMHKLKAVRQYACFIALTLLAGLMDELYCIGLWAREGEVR